MINQFQHWPRLVKMLNLIAVLAVLLVSVADEAIAASSVDWEVQKVEVEPDSPLTSFTIRIRGPIEKETPGKVRGALAELDRIAKSIGLMRGADPINFHLNSLGGEIEAALVIGLLIRETRGNVLIGDGDVCVSACVLIAAGGLSRSLNGRIGIHRPYFEVPATVPSEGEVAAAISKVRTAIRDYLTFMNVDPRLEADMFKILPADVRYLSTPDLRDYGLLAVDPVHAEAAALRAAARWGLNRAEYENRRARADRTCPSPDFGNTMSCYDDVMAGRR